MTNQTKSKTFLQFLHYPQAEFYSEILVLPLPQCNRGTGHGGWGQFIICCLSCCFSTPSEDSFSSTGSLSWKQSFIYFSNLSPLHGLQFSMNCSSGGPFHWLQSLRNNVGPPRGSQVLPLNLLQCGFLSFQDPAPAQVSPRTLMSLAWPEAGPSYAVWHWLYHTWQKLLAASSKATPAAPLSPSLPKPGHTNPIHTKLPSNNSKCYLSITR